MMRTRNFLQFFIFLMVVFFGFVGETRAESNESISSLEQETSELIEICGSFSSSTNHDPQELKVISDRLLDKRFVNNSKFYAYGYLALAESKYYSQAYSDALIYYQQALSAFELIKDSDRIASIYNSIGVVHFILGNDNEACEAYLKSFKFYEAIGDKQGMGQMYNNLALIYWRSYNYEKADYYALKGIALYKELGEQKYLADMYNNYALNLVNRKKYDEALSYYHQALNIYQRFSADGERAIVISNIGTIFFERLNNVDSANFYYHKALMAWAQNKDTVSLVNGYRRLAQLNMSCKDYKLAISNLLEAERLNEKTNNIVYGLKTSAELSICYEALGDFKEALRRSRLYNQLSDSISKTETQKKIAEVESKFQVQQTKNEMAVLQQKSTLTTIILLSLFIVVLLIAVAIFFYWKSYKMREEQRVLMLEHKVLRTQMDPHFIFNAMSALQCYIMDDKPDDAIRFLSDFSALLRLVLQYSKNELIPVAKEKKILDHYLALQNKRFDNKIKFDIVVGQELLDGNVMMPPMLAQPFVENSLEHGGLHSIEDAMILISLKKEGDFIRLSIEDNGIGIEQSKLVVKETKHKSMAISITQDRLKLLNTHHKGKVNFSMKDLSHEGSRGTRVEFLIPIT